MGLSLGSLSHGELSVHLAVLLVWCLLALHFYLGCVDLGSSAVLTILEELSALGVQCLTFQVGVSLPVTS